MSFTIYVDVIRKLIRQNMDTDIFIKKNTDVL